MDISKSLSFCERRTNSGEIDFFYFAFTHLAILIAITFSDLFDAGIVKTLVVAGLTILYFSMRY